MGEFLISRFTFLRMMLLRQTGIAKGTLVLWQKRIMSINTEG